MSPEGHFTPLDEHTGKPKKKALEQPSGRVRQLQREKFEPIKTKVALRQAEAHRSEQRKKAEGAALRYREREERVVGRKPLRGKGGRIGAERVAPQKVKQAAAEVRQVKEQAETYKAKEAAQEAEWKARQERGLEVEARYKERLALERKARRRQKVQYISRPGFFDYGPGIAKVKAKAKRPRAKVRPKAKVKQVEAYKAKVTKVYKIVNKRRVKRKKVRPKGDWLLDFTPDRTEFDYGPGIAKVKARRKPARKVPSVKPKVTKKAATQRDLRTGRFISTGPARAKRVVTSQKLMLNYQDFRKWVESRNVSKATKERYYRDWRQFHPTPRKFTMEFQVVGVFVDGRREIFNWESFAYDDFHLTKEEIMAAWAECQESVKGSQGGMRVISFKRYIAKDFYNMGMVVWHA